MSVRIESQAEPIPGYKLLDRLGSGGFGEVWKAEAPGGIFKAIKIIFGDLRSQDNDLIRYAEQELKALKRVKMVRHPYLLALDRYDIVDGRLMITMELADCNLWDRFRECRDKGLPGIPRDELMMYMLETAEVLDLMNDQHQLQHLDIKPQNLFMLHNHVKVADFGQVKDLQGVMASVTGGITPVYAAPETFDGIVSRFCDQYSLACVYQELLTGQRPFDGSSMSQLLMQHLQMPPDLQSSPAHDRPALNRALAKKADDRWPNCMAFVKSLRDAGTSGSRERRSLPAEAAPASGSRIIGGEDPDTHYSGGGSFSSYAGLALETPSPRSMAETDSHLPFIASAPPEVAGPGPLRPALVVGLGQTGLRILQRLRYDLTERFGPPNFTPLLRTLFVDTDADAIDDALHTRPLERLAGLQPDDVIPAKLNRAAHYLKPRLNGRSLTEGWFDPQLLYRIPRNPQTLGFRLFGRLAFCDHYRAVMSRVQAELDAALLPDSQHLTEARTGLKPGSNRPRVYLVAGLAGGTGSGMLLDLAYSVRSRLKRLGYENPDVVGVLVAPPADPSITPPNALGNCYAALTELNHYSRPDTTFTASYDDRHAVIRDKDAPFSRCYLIPGSAVGLLASRMTPPASGLQPQPRNRTPAQIAHPGSRRSSSGAIAKPGSRTINSAAVLRVPDSNPGLAALKPFADAAELIRLSLFGPIGRAADASRADKLADAPSTGTTFASFGHTSFDWPRAEVVGRTTTPVVRTILKRWVAPDLKRAREVVPGWAAEHWTQYGLDPDTIIGHLQASAEAVVGSKIEELIALTIEPLVPKGWLARLPEPDRLAIGLDRLVKLLGPPASTMKRPPTPVEDALAAAAASAAEGFVLDLHAVGPALVEDPQFRLAGAEEILRQFLATTDRLIDRFTQIAGEQDLKAQTGYECLAQYAHFQKGTKKLAAAEAAEALRQFPRARFQALTARQLVGVYQAVRDGLADQLADVANCRQRMEAAASVAEPHVEDFDATAPPRRLMPPGCPTVHDSVQRFLGVLSETDYTAIDDRIQAALEPDFGGLFNACLNSTAGADGVVNAVWEEARSYLDARLGEVDLAAMFAERFRSQHLAEKAVEQAYQEADPAWAGNGPWNASEVTVVSVPPSASAAPLRELTRRAIPVAGLPMVDTRDEVTVYRELPAVPLSVLPHFGPAAAAAYASLPDANQCSPHSRLDITRWLDPDAQ